MTLCQKILTENDLDSVPRTPQRHFNKNLLKRKIEQEKTSDVIVTTEAQLEFDYRDSSTYIAKEKKMKKLFNKSYKMPKQFYPLHKFFYTIFNESVSKKNIRMVKLCSP